MKKSIFISASFIIMFLIGCKNDPKTNVSESVSHAEESTTESKVKVNPNKDAYFGNLHVHTSWSFDGYTNGSVTTPDDAYRWAKGEAIPGGGGGGDLQIKVPLDWYAVSDHAEYMGVFKKMEDPESPFSKLPIAKRITSDDVSVSFAAFAEVLDGMNKGVPQDELTDSNLAKSLWKEIIAIGDKHNEPGKFTTFSAFEWTSAPNNRNLHRVVLFGNNSNIPSLPYSVFDSAKPEDLWVYMENARTKGATLLAVPHNGNASDGMMFELVDSEDNAITKAYSETRMRNEPLYEITQIKGTSEVHPDLSPNDEFANFELWDYTLSAITERPKNRKGSYLREAYKDGLKLDSEGAGNPFKYGIIGDSDTHNSASSIEEDNYTGKFGMENNPEHRLEGIPGNKEASNQQIREFSSGGLAGVWAESNTRESIFEALKRKETFGTSGPRMKVRFFGGYNYSEDLVSQTNWLNTAYESGVPMGSNLQSSTGKSPTFVIHAVKEADGANLDRIQVIKGWLDANGKTHEKIYNVAMSDGRTAESNGNVSDVGNTVDIKNASYTNDIGATELKTVWTDPDFNAQQYAFYYVRVLEIPTPRWSTYDAKTLGIEPRKDLPATIQERAWSSPIWYNPN
ncbi:DUF3604 domain-containing protein [Mangrovimonas sp. ST2L15]|uniref:DUF3604 domain-containing protein n=1 Tax=Mangrovimonas sp. ST2L15 TaxID=1645916 RepID=UPI0009E6ECB7|nr:DUF3604 domain-containing protein [Mangrovimonas sp. ST2L15]